MRSGVSRALRTGRRGAGRFTLAALLALFALPALGADRALIAVATNFLPTAKQLARAFTDSGGAPLTLTSGATGKLYAQLLNGAPYELFLAADIARPEKLEAADRILPGSRRSYALGTLVLWQPEAGPDEYGPLTTLRDGHFRRLAIAHPALAPYGAAAEQFLRKLDLWATFAPRLARGENIGQTYAMAASGNADLALVAASQFGTERPGRRWTLTPGWHDPIEQQMVLLKGAGDAAQAFHAFVLSDAARAQINRSGYRLPQAIRSVPDGGR